MDSDNLTIPRAYAQWVVIVLNNLSTETITIKNVVLSYGKFHEAGSKDNEIDKNDVQGVKIVPRGTFSIYSCGRSDSPSGTEGSFDLVDNSTNQLIRNIYWDCPWGSSRNTFNITGVNGDWIVEGNGANLESGALGNVTVKAVKF